MQPNDWKIHIEDMVQAIQNVALYIHGLDFEHFSSNQMVIHAVLYNLAILGEAIRGVPLDVQMRHAEVPWAEARAMRNKVIHEYHGVSLIILWETITSDLPSLQTLLQGMLDPEDPKS